MQINCPICSTPIDIAREHLGQKGRCTTCSTKFIIPATLADDFEILERGTPPEKPAEPAAAPETGAAPKVSRAAAPATAAKAAPKTGDGDGDKKPALATPKGGAPRGVPAHLMRQKKSGNAGFIITCLVIGGALAFGWVKLSDKDKAASDDVADTSGAGEAEKPLTHSPRAERPPSQPEVVENPPATVDPDAPTDDPEPAPFEAPTPEETVAELADDKKQRALAFLKSEQPNKRKGAFKAMRNLGDAHKKTYADLLTQAREHHLKQLGDAAFELSVGQNSMTAFEDAYETWQSTAKSALQMVLTNWKAQDANGYKAKHAEMDSAFGDAEKLHGAVVRAMGNAGGPQVKALDDRVPMFAEFDAELAWANGEEAPSSPALGALIKEAGGADDFAELLGLLDSARAGIAEFETAEAHNKSINWGTSTYKKFAELLNSRRQVLGLGALRLDEKLSLACEGHSGDMLFLGYFSHTGNDGSSFGQRAKRAGFVGSPAGECIFKGSPAAEAAHKAWWYSDGHRMIMYANGPNTLGLGTASEIWTLNTGRRDW